jgi:hypothetical protein
MKQRAFYYLSHVIYYLLAQLNGKPPLTVDCANSLKNCVYDTFKGNKNHTNYQEYIKIIKIALELNRP